MCPQRPKEGVRFPQSWHYRQVTPNLGTENQAQILSKSNSSASSLQVDPTPSLIHKYFLFV